MLFAVCIFLVHQIWILLELAISTILLDHDAVWIAFVVAAVSVAECRLVGPDDVQIVLVARGGIRCSHWPMLSAIIRIIDSWPRNPVDKCRSIFEINNWWPLIHVVLCPVALASKRNVPPFLHWRFGHWAVVYIAVSIERRLYFSMGGWMWVVVALVVVERMTSHQFLGLLRLSKISSEHANSLKFSSSHCCIGSCVGEWCIVIIYEAMMLPALLVHRWLLAVVLFIYISQVWIKISVQSSRLRVLPVWVNRRHDWRRVACTCGGTLFTLKTHDCSSFIISSIPKVWAIIQVL